MLRFSMDIKILETSNKYIFHLFLKNKAYIFRKNLSKPESKINKLYQYYIVVLVNFCNLKIKVFKYLNFE